MAAVLVDAGPLVALFNENDGEHAVCRRVMSTLEDKILTVWPAITEASHFLLSKSWRGVDELLGIIGSGHLGIIPLGEDDAPRMRELMEKYADLPMDLADAAIVSAAERENIETIFTIDRRDFSLYRPRHVKQFKLLP